MVYIGSTGEYKRRQMIAHMKHKRRANHKVHGKGKYTGCRGECRGEVHTRIIQRRIQRIQRTMTHTHTHNAN